MVKISGTTTIMINCRVIAGRIRLILLGDNRFLYCARLAAISVMFPLASISRKPIRGNVGAPGFRTYCEIIAKLELRKLLVT